MVHWPMTQNETLPAVAAGQRGPADHAIRSQIIAAAGEHFKHYGFQKTTVSDLAKAIGFSKAYIYKFFDSKQAIGEAICAECLEKIALAATEASAGGRTATERFRKFFRATVDTSAKLFFHERRLFDIAALSIEEKWPTSTLHNEKMIALLTSILVAGRQWGEFERKTPLDETARVIFQSMQPFTNPLMLMHNLDSLHDGPTEVANLVLRSLTP